jgi:hypothetical protein
MKLQRAITATFLTALVLALAAVPAQAGGRHREGHGHGGHRQSIHRGVAVRPIPVPVRIHSRDFRQYAPYASTRAWSGVHRHYHAIYAFPVLLRPGYVTYAPHIYCDGRLVGRGDVVLDRGAARYADYEDDRYGGHDHRYDERYDDRAQVRYRWDERVSGYVAFGGPNFRVGIGF